MFVDWGIDFMKESSKETKSLFYFIWKFIKFQPWKCFFILIFSLVWPLDAAVVPYILGVIIDKINEFDTNRAMAWYSMKGWILSGVLIWIAVEVSYRLKDFIQAFCFSKMEGDIRMHMFDHVQRHSPHYFNEHFAGSLSNKISDMASESRQILERFTLFILFFVSSAISIAFFYFVNPLFALLLGVWILTHIGFSLLFGKKGCSLANVHAETRSTLVGKIVDSLTNNFAVNLFYRFRSEYDCINKFQKKEFETHYQERKFIAWSFVAISVMYLGGMIFINGFALLLWFQERITTGEIVQVFNTTWSIGTLLWWIGESLPWFFRSVGIGRQALAIMQHPQDILDRQNAASLIVKKGEIVFDKVSFDYGNKRLFDKLSISISGGEKVGLVGYSGAGKSTFINLILRFYPINGGEIQIDGQNIAHISLESLRNQVALIPQDPQLFHRTIEENIRFGRLDATKNEMLEAAKNAYCDPFIQKTVSGYQSKVGERGTKLSGGERQRMAIARVMLKKAPILILDEATSALDSSTEQLIQNSLEKLMKNRTTLVIAHRLSTLAKMDRILVFHEGGIIEDGSHAELLKLEGHYAFLWKKQVGGFLPEKPLQTASL